MGADLRRGDVIMSGIIRWGVMLLIVGGILNYLGLSPSGLWQDMTGKLDNFKSDTQKLTSGEASQQVSQRLKAELQSPANQPATDHLSEDEKKLAQELQTERKRLMEAKAAALQNVQVIPTDTSKLSEQLVKSAQQAGGGN
jgi:hypothetical protein